MYESVAKLPCGEVTVAKLPCGEVTGNRYGYHEVTMWRSYWQPTGTPPPPLPNEKLF